MLRRVRPNRQAAVCHSDIDSIAFRRPWCWCGACLAGPLPCGFMRSSRLIPLLISIKVSVFQCALFQFICLLLRFLSKIVLFLDSPRFLFCTFDPVGISRDFSFEFFTKLSSNVLYFFSIFATVRSLLLCTSPAIPLFALQSFSDYSRFLF